jgi:hypothetical protein
VPEADVEYEVLRRGFVGRTRKPHPCTYCAGAIPVGSPAYTVTVKSEGRVFTDYRHTAAACEVAP